VYSEGIPLNQISIIYTSEYFSDPNSTELINAITTALNANGLFFHWVSQDSRAKMSYDVTADRIALSSIHSIKGFDHSCVFLLGLDMLKANKWTKGQIDMMTYVAITRARDRLYIPYTEKTELIEKLHESISVLTVQ
jgi:superfamily I DNA/RNA helicase